MAVFIVLVNTDKAFPQPVKIGLLIQDSSYTSAMHGAELAVRKANETGGMNGRLFRLVTRSMEGPWGTGSKQAVDLIFNEKVWALLGSHDGRNAHLAEQAATKSTVVFVSAWAGDPTLSQAFVPWFFNCVPDYARQAEALIEEICDKRKLNRIGCVFGNDYDSKLAFETFRKRMRNTGKNDPVPIVYQDYNNNPDRLIDKIISSDLKCIILFGGPAESFEIIKLIRRREITIPVFGSISLFNENILTAKEMQDFNNMILVPAGEWPPAGISEFQQEYRKNYGSDPGMMAAYAYDGMSILIKAILDAGGPDREIIQESLKRIQHNGITGSVRFDANGNRTSPLQIVKIVNGFPVKTDP